MVHLNIRSKQNKFRGNVDVLMFSETEIGKCDILLYGQKSIPTCLQ